MSRVIFGGLCDIHGRVLMLAIVKKLRLHYEPTFIPNRSGSCGLDK